MTRRALTLAAPAALLAQTRPAEPAPQNPPAPQGPEQELNAAREQQQRSAAELSKVAVPISIEPACHFKA